uniref:Uncharacterized protein n=1 Tax=Kalanchoe fedtschenkoi TaxID=63787 RepID=A0A7N0TT48_KALFE
MGQQEINRSINSSLGLRRSWPRRRTKISDDGGRRDVRGFGMGGWRNHEEEIQRLWLKCADRGIGGEQCERKLRVEDNREHERKLRHERKLWLEKSGERSMAAMCINLTEEARVASQRRQENKSSDQGMEDKDNFLEKK